MQRCAAQERGDGASTSGGNEAAEAAEVMNKTNNDWGCHTSDGAVVLVSGSQ